MEIETSPDYSFESHFVPIKDSGIHYIDEKSCSECDTVFLFLHGNPTSGFLWRNIIPYLTTCGRCIAPDLIGFGKSDKPDIGYTFDDHFLYIQAFIEKLNLQNLVLVLHDWGGAIGFHYAMQNPDKIRGIVFMETFYKPMEWDTLNLATKWLLKKFRDPKIGNFLNGKLNLFVRLILPLSMYHRLTKKEKQIYNEPFSTPESRKPVIMFPLELPFLDSKTNNERIADQYFRWLCTTKIPKLLIYAKPGVQIKWKQVLELKSKLNNLSVEYVGRGKHFIQEDQPEHIGKAINQWYKKNTGLQSANAFVF